MAKVVFPAVLPSHWPSSRCNNSNAIVYVLFPCLVILTTYSPSTATNYLWLKLTGRIPNLFPWTPSKFLQVNDIQQYYLRIIPCKIIGSDRNPMSLGLHLVLRVASILQSWGMLVHRQRILRQSRTQWHATFGRLIYILFTILVLPDILGRVVRILSWVLFMSSTSLVNNTNWMEWLGSLRRFLFFCRFWVAQKHHKISFQKGQFMYYLQTKSLRSPYRGREKVLWVCSFLLVMYHFISAPASFPSSRSMCSALLIIPCSFWLILLQHAFSVVRSAGSHDYNFLSPVRRDTVNTGIGNDNVTIRFVTDNAGPWFLHWQVYTFCDLWR